MAKDLIPSTYPLTPPLTEEEWHNWLRLLRSRRVGISTFYRLLNEFGDAATALDALPNIAKDAGLSGYRAANADDIRHEWANAKRLHAHPIAIGSPAYPDRLADIPDAPPILWTMGDPKHLTSPTIAIVGARNASSLGTRTARRLAADLGAAGYTIVSGLARGVDTAAHIAALDTGTIAVMAGGVDVIYP
ncbi:MAG: DNA-protecting protein DprA, partial [Boseongicola sp.]|nr:DNA-protecting protein DprA [Boseongicola sp.]